MPPRFITAVLSYCAIVAGCPLIEVELESCYDTHVYLFNPFIVQTCSIHFNITLSYTHDNRPTYDNRQSLTQEEQKEKGRIGLDYIPVFSLPNVEL
jgi:hypothetical protein